MSFFPFGNDPRRDPRMLELEALAKSAKLRRQADDLTAHDPLGAPPPRPPGPLRRLWRRFRHNT